MHSSDLRVLLEKRQPLAKFWLVGVYKPAKTALMNMYKKKKIGKKALVHLQDQQTLPLMCKHVLGYHATSNLSDQ